MLNNQSIDVLKNINFYFSKSRLTKKEFARLIGVTEVTVQRILSDKQSIKVDMLLKIADVLEIDVINLFTREENDQLKVSHDDYIEMDKEERRKYNIYLNFVTFLEYFDCVEVDKIKPAIEQITGKVATKKSIPVSALMKYFASFKSKTDAIKSLYQYINKEEYLKSDMAKDFTSEHNAWFMDYINQIRNSQK
jgi:transcriptional regulator with XRE-family HTH domain